MSSEPSNPTSREQRVNDVIAAYVEASDAGERPDPQKILDQNPDLADDLRAFFADYERMNQMAAPMRPAAEPAVDLGRDNAEINRDAATLPPSSLVASPRAPSDATPDLSASGPQPSTLDPQPSPTRLRYFGDYELLEEIARGGMGVVYKARQVSLNRIVAVKMILAGQLAGPDDVRRFRTEAEAAAQLQHPNIVAIHEIGEHDGRHYFSMDYVDGKSLAAAVGGKPMPAVKAAGCVKTLAEAVHFAHLRGILHRDLKPSNVLIDAADQPHITDFGLAKQIEKRTHLTQTGAVLGTPSYMPPEQAAGNRGEVGPPSDVYSLGAILYELLTGRPPFQASNVMDTLIQVLEDDPPSPRKLNPQVPPDLETICLKCLEKRPERRYPSARELAEELGRFLNQEPILARRAGTFHRAWSWTKRRPWAITACVSVCLLGLLTLSFWLWSENRYLKWLANNPEYVRQPGRWTDWTDNAAGVNSFCWVGLCFFYPWFSRRISHDRGEGRAISSWLLFSAVACGAIGLVLGIAQVFLTIEADVWESTRSMTYEWLFAYFVSFWGILLLVRVARVYEFLAFGRGVSELRNLLEDKWRRPPMQSFWRTPVSQLLLEDEYSQVLAWLLAGSKIDAIKLYREKTGADLAEAQRVVEQIQDDYQNQNPDWVPPRPTARWMLMTYVLILMFTILGSFILQMAYGLQQGPMVLGTVVGLWCAIALRGFAGPSRNARRGVWFLLLACGIGAWALWYENTSLLAGLAVGGVGGLVAGAILWLARVCSKPPA